MLETTRALQKEDIKFVDLNICPETLTMFYLSEITRIDLLTLTLLFERLGSSLYYLFYLLAKRKISFPSEANLLKAIKFSEVVESLDNNYSNVNKIPQKDKDIFQKLLNSVVDKKYIRLQVDALQSISAPCVQNTEVVTPVVKSELSSSIKKYIRKEKRKLDKAGKMYTLFDKTSLNRINLINKIHDSFINKVNEADNIGDLKEFIGTLIDGYNK